MKMKKLLVLMLAGALSFATLTGCSDDAPEEENKQTADADAKEDAEEDADTEEEYEEEDADVEEDADAEEEYEEEDADAEEEYEEEDADAEEEYEEEEQDAQIIQVPVYIANATGVGFHEIYLSISGSDEWGENLLPEGQYLPSGSILPLNLNIASEEGITWDLEVVDSEGTYIDWYELNISEMPTSGFAIELMWDGENGTAKLAETPDQLEGNYTPAE